MQVKFLCDYMKARAKFEGVSWKMPDKTIQQYFNLGTRMFFGVELNERGNLLSDVQQPEFFERWQQKLNAN